MIGRYERGEGMPSIEVAKKIADAQEVTLDYLAGNSKKAAIDKQTMKLIHNIEDLELSLKDKLIFLANAVIIVKLKKLTRKKTANNRCAFSISYTYAGTRITKLTKPALHPHIIAK